jgi:hypothetical protein
MLYPDNTRISVAIEEHEGQRLLITDNGEASDYAFANGIGEPAIRDRSRMTARRFGLSDTRDGELMLDVHRSELADGVFRIANAIQDVGYLVYRRSSARSRRKFKESVESYLSLTGMSFTKDISIPGRTGRRHFDYEVSGGGARQLLLSIFAPLSEKTAIERAKVIAFDYGDIRGEGDESSPLPLVVLVDDTSDRVRASYSDEVGAILESHVSRVISWKNRDELDDLLIAA